MDERTGQRLSKAERDVIGAVKALENCEDYVAFSHNASIIVKYETGLLGCSKVPDIEIFSIDSKENTIAVYIPERNVIVFDSIITKIKAIDVVESICVCAMDCANFERLDKEKEDSSLYGKTRRLWYHDMIG